MNYLLDTNILSETIKKSPSAKVVSWLNSISQEKLYISVLTVGEIRKGIEKLPHGKNKQKLLNWLEVELISWFENKIIAIDINVADKWGYINALSKATPAIDGLIAATALTKNLTLVTRNIKDFKNISGLELLNPWDL